MSRPKQTSRPKRTERHIMRILMGYVDLIKEGGNGAEMACYRNEWGETSEWIHRAARKKKIKIPEKGGGLGFRGSAATPGLYSNWT